MFGKKKKTAEALPPFDPSRQKAVLKCSICNGEQVFGFKDRTDCHFEEVAYIRDPRELEKYREAYGLSEVPKEY